MSGQDVRVPRAGEHAPLLGAHTQEVLSEWLAPRSISAFREAALHRSKPDSTEFGFSSVDVRVLDLTHNERALRARKLWHGWEPTWSQVEPAQGERGR